VIFGALSRTIYRNSVNHRFIRHCEEGVLPDEAVSSLQEGIASQRTLAMTIAGSVFVKPRFTEIDRSVEKNAVNSESYFIRTRRAKRLEQEGSLRVGKSTKVTRRIYGKLRSFYHHA
jgi:hypothetical protein